MHYPAFLDLEGKRCLVVGGGKVAERKVRALLKCGAEVVCVSASFIPFLERLGRSSKIELVSRRLKPETSLASLLKGMFLVVAATSFPSLNAKVYEACRKRNLLINVVDDPRHSNFIAPSVVRRGPLAIAVSTGGASPAFAKSVREKIAGHVGPEYGAFLEFMRRERGHIMRWVKDRQRRKRLFEDLVSSGLLNLFKRNDRGAIRKKYESILLRYGVRKESLK